MRKELRLLLTAVMFYTRIPCPRWVGHDDQHIAQSTRYFPFMGWIVGGLYAALVLLFDLLFPSHISILLGILGSVLITGAFHEDGLADVCDGFGGGWTKEKILDIMKDSRIGTYGVIGLVLVFFLKFYSTVQLYPSTDPLLFVALVVSSHSLSRAMSVVIIYTLPYVRMDPSSKAKPVSTGIGLSGLLVASFFGLIPFLYFIIRSAHWPFVFVLLFMGAITMYLAFYFKKWIGGYTGDCLGATQQINEVMFLIGLLALQQNM